MKGELLYAYSPMRWRIMWTIVYILILAGGTAALYGLGNQVGTHTIPVGNVKLIIPYSKYLLGETISFTIQNGFNSNIYVNNNCPTEPLNVFRLDRGVWKRIHDVANLKDCDNQSRQILVPANGLTSGTFNAWHHLFDKPGKYRVVAYVDYYNALPYQDFEIIAKPEVPKVPAASPSPSLSPINSNNGTSKSTLKPSSPAASGQSSPSRKSKTVTTSGGSISVEYDASTVYVISITPAPGFTYEGGRSGRQVEVTFKGNTEIQVQLTVVNGQLVTHIESGG